MKKVASIKNANLATSHSGTTSPRKQEPLQGLSEGDLLKLHQRLLGSLDPGTIINRFFGWLSEFQLVGGIDYVHQDENLCLSTGSSKPHKVNYVLRLEQQYLGEVTITSQKRFDEQAMFNQEQGLGVLVQYLKNAIAFQSLERVAFHDSLTGLMNRTALDELLPKETKRAQRYGYDLSVLMIDIDHFKSINDCIGHMGGDAILRQVSTAIKSQLRDSDLPFRYGGDEFLLMLPNTRLEGAHKAAHQIMEALNKTMTEASNQTISPKLSIGVASYKAGENHEELMRRVDNALYDAKNNGRNRINATS